jgi:D-sedoheptulose 7-phosphate isomerase
MGIAEGVPAAEALVRAAERIATGFRAGGRLLVSGSGRTVADAQHVVVEFQHPVTVGKRALPALPLGGRRGPADVTVSIGYDGAGVDPGADVVVTDRAPVATGADNVLVRLPGEPGRAKVAAVLAYHVMWELTHLFLEGAESTAEPSGRAGDDPAAAALYPMLYRRSDPGSIDALRAAALRSAESKLVESGTVVEAALAANRPMLQRVAELVASADAVFTFGNGGSSTDAADAAHVLGPRVRSLTDDVATITALANDVSFDVVFARQLATLGRAGDGAIGFSTSGGSTNVLRAAESAERIGMWTVGFAGYDGGAMAASPSFDVVLVAPSDSVHRIQEAQSALVAELARLVGV